MFHHRNGYGNQYPNVEINAPNQSWLRGINVPISGSMAVNDIYNNSGCDSQYPNVRSMMAKVPL